jgi:hypothetical protein
MRIELLNNTYIIAYPTKINIETNVFWPRKIIQLNILSIIMFIMK